MFYRPHNRIHPDLSGPSMTEQSHKDQCDIHNILKQFQRTGIIQHINRHQPSFDNLPDTIDFQESMNIVLEAEDNFNRLPAALRAEYNNDPGTFLQALHNPANHDRFRQLGILKPLPVEQPGDPGNGAPPNNPLPPS